MVVLLEHTLTGSSVSVFQPTLEFMQDGPTHQPVETVSGLRVFPNMDVMRPADPEETAAAYAAALDRKDGPTALILTRQNVRTLKEIPVRFFASNLQKLGFVVVLVELIDYLGIRWVRPTLFVNFCETSKTLCVVE